MRALITGISGFVGSHLAEHLVAEGDEVAGISRRACFPPDWKIADRVKLFRGDIGCREFMERVLKEVAPEVVYHVAAVASVPESMREPERTWRTNLDATRLLYELLCRLPETRRPRVVFASTGSIYRPAVPGQRLDEEAVLAPASPYAASKAAADLLSFQVAVNYGLHIVRLRCFNQLGPRQRLGFVAADVAAQIARAERGLQPPEIRVGDTRAIRDFTDVRDVVRAFRLAARSAPSGTVFNVGSGTGRRIAELIEQLIQHSRAAVKIVVDSTKCRPGDPTALVADPRRLAESTGWQPRIAFRQSVADLLDDWRRRIG